MKHSKSAQLKTAPTKYGGQSVFLFFEFTIDTREISYSISRYRIHGLMSRYAGVGIDGNKSD